jgi:hypothetical protein
VLRAEKFTANTAEPDPLGAEARLDSESRGAPNTERVRAIVRRLYDEGSEVFDDFGTFSDAVMFTIAKQLNVTTDSFEPAAVTDFGKLVPILFVDGHTIPHGSV